MVQPRQEMAISTVNCLPALPTNMVHKKQACCNKCTMTFAICSSYLEEDCQTGSVLGADIVCFAVSAGSDSLLIIALAIVLSLLVESCIFCFYVLQKALSGRLGHGLRKALLRLHSLLILLLLASARPMGLPHGADQQQDSGRLCSLTELA